MTPCKNWKTYNHDLPGKGGSRNIQEIRYCDRDETNLSSYTNIIEPVKKGLPMEGPLRGPLSCNGDENSSKCHFKGK